MTITRALLVAGALALLLSSVASLYWYTHERYDDARNVSVLARGFLHPRLSVVVAVESTGWRVQYMQFRFVVDCNPLLLAIGLLPLCLVGTSAWVAVITAGMFSCLRRAG